MNKNILMTEHERTLNEISLEGIKWREDRIVRLEEALRDLLDGDGDMTAARIAKARAALGSSSETPVVVRNGPLIPGPWNDDLWRCPKCFMIEGHRHEKFCPTLETKADPASEDTYTNGTSFSDKTVSDFYRTRGPYALHPYEGSPTVNRGETCLKCGYDIDASMHTSKTKGDAT